VTRLRPPYDEFAKQELILRDWLAIDRTALANERTLLAYTRTGLALAIVGASLIKFFDSLTADVTGSLFLAAGLVAVAVGLTRFLGVRRRLALLCRQPAESKDESSRGRPRASGERF